MELLIGRFHEEKRRIMELVVRVLAIPYAVLLLWASINLVRHYAEHGVIADTVLETHLVIPALFISFGCLLLLIELIRDFFRYLGKKRV